ncbi:MAG TPA: ATP synthase subunit I [Gammaproteobacteria bacterium]|nr:ATP synthase subunit I [Gammaproteobacteria bacterium]
MRTEYARLLGLQSVIVISGATVIYKVVDLPAAKSFVYGSIVAMIGALLVAWRYRQALRHSEADQILRHAYKTSVERFVWAIFLLALGFKILELAPLWLMAGFVVGQAAWLLAPIWMRLRTQNDK